MKLSRFLINSVLCSLALSCASLNVQGQSPTDLSRLVVVGDSISAGVQNFSLLGTQQVHGYASVIAQQANVPMVLPLVPYPGVPQVLQLTSLNPVTIQPAPGPLPSPPRADPCAQPTNVSVPGVTLEQALTMIPAVPKPGDSPVQGWANIVLGFPSPFAAGVCRGASQAALTEVQQAIALKPTAIIEWLGNNDVLVPALIGHPEYLTPAPVFFSSFDTLLDTLKQANVPILTATIPDVSRIAYFTPLTVIATQANLPVKTVAEKLGLDPGDLLRPTAVPIALEILAGQQKPEFPASCPAPALQLPVPTVPCVLRVSDAEAVQATINAFNSYIRKSSELRGATVVDVHALLEDLAQNGYKATGKHLTTEFLGGIFSLDGIHPSNTGYGIIANRFIEVMNQAWGTNIPEANVNEIAAHDPLVPPINLTKQ